jgi:hypothetical protein
LCLLEYIGLERLVLEPLCLVLGEDCLELLEFRLGLACALVCTRFGQDLGEALEDRLLVQLVLVEWQAGASVVCKNE